MLGQPVTSMALVSPARRAQTARNRRKAEALVAEMGDRAGAYVAERVTASRWHIRDHEHWLRIERHVRTLLGTR